MLRKLLFGAAAAGAISWLAKNQDQAKAYAQRYGGQLKGAAGSVTPGAGRAPAEERLNDPALARKVESEIFRDDTFAKGDIDVNAEYGVIYLRGEVASSDLRDRLTAQTRAVDGVRAVDNLTHLPGEAAPTKEEIGSSPA
ncbi:MAG TPA: BON domain-containing protein [Thermoleophilaceae bacterium]|jgi:osmotically-inducible protein OsmY|nr:BON domain-containing protein [Thermoleophilaceae bacterium]